MIKGMINEMIKGVIKVMRRMTYAICHRAMMPWHMSQGNDAICHGAMPSWGKSAQEAMPAIYEDDHMGQCHAMPAILP